MSHRFVGQLDWMLQRLSGAHVRITLMRVVLPGPAARVRGMAEAITEALDDSFGLAGMLGDGSVLAAFFGPRQPGAGGDRQQAQAILRRLRLLLQDAGLEREAAGASVFLAHRWTDEIDDLSSLMLESTASDRRRITLFEPLSA